MPTASPSAVVLGTSMTALSVVRSLGRRGVRVVVCEVGKPLIASHSKYVRQSIACDTEGELVERLLTRGLGGASPVVLIPTTDEYLLLLSRSRPALHASFRYLFPPAHSLESLVGKQSSAELFRRLEIPAPKTVYLPRDGSATEAASELRVPLIVKPNLHASWLSNPLFLYEFGHQKVILVERSDSLVPLLERLLDFDDLVLQEYLPGESSRLYYFVGYRARGGAMLASFLGRKHRTLPEGLGTEVLFESVHNVEAERTAIQALDKLDYVGIAGVDLKFDGRDRTFKVIEINFRFGSSDGLAVACGMDLPYVAFTDAVGREALPSGGYACGVFWNWLERDIDWLRDHRESQGYSVIRWCWHHLTHRYHYPYFALDDLTPWLVELGRFLMRVVRRVLPATG